MWKGWVEAGLTWMWGSFPSSIPVRSSTWDHMDSVSMPALPPLWGHWGGLSGLGCSQSQALPPASPLGCCFPRELRVPLAVWLCMTEEDLTPHLQCFEAQGSITDPSSTFPDSAAVPSHAPATSRRENSHLSARSLKNIPQSCMEAAKMGSGACAAS